MQNPQELREITVAQIEAFADAPDDEMAQTLVLDSIDEEIRAVRREYEHIAAAAQELLDVAKNALPPDGEARVRYEIAISSMETLLGASTG